MQKGLWTGEGKGTNVFPCTGDHYTCTFPEENNLNFSGSVVVLSPTHKLPTTQAQAQVSTTVGTFCLLHIQGSWDSQNRFHVRLKTHVGTLGVYELNLKAKTHVSFIAQGKEDEPLIHWTRRSVCERAVSGNGNEDRAAQKERSPRG